MISNNDAVSGAWAWWGGLTPDPIRGHPGNRGAIARLRRCSTVADAMHQPETIDLFRRCRATHQKDLLDIALVAAVLSHVDKDKNGITVARQVGADGPDAPATAVFKPLRFKRLLEASESDECLTTFRRLVAIAGGEINVRDLTIALLGWNNPYHAAEIKRNWMLDYWNANPTRATTQNATLSEVSAK